jgi:hypothetical protein
MNHERVETKVVRIDDGSNTFETASNESNPGTSETVLKPKVSTGSIDLQQYFEAQCN